MRDFPDLRFTINGGITSVSKVTHLGYESLAFFLHDQGKTEKISVIVR